MAKSRVQSSRRSRISKTCLPLLVVRRRSTQVRASTTSEGRGSIDPNHEHFFCTRIVPTMSAVALEPKTFVLVEDIALCFVEPDFEFAFQHIDPVFALVRVSAVAARSRRDAHQHGLEHFRARREKFHPHSRLRLNGLTLPRTHDAVRLFRNLV